MAWAPTNDFEEEIVSMQPDHHFIFDALCLQRPEVHYPRPKSHIEFLRNQNKRNQSKGDLKALGHPRSKAISSQLAVLETLQRIAGTKPIGEVPVLEDWENCDTLEKETIAIMRHCGYGSCIDQALNSASSISTMPVNGVRIVQNGRINRPLLYDDKFFKMEHVLEKPIPSNKNRNEYENLSDTPTENKRDLNFLRHKMYSNSERIKNASIGNGNDESMQLDLLQLNGLPDAQENIEFMPTRTFQCRKNTGHLASKTQKPSKAEQFKKPKELYQPKHH